MQSNPTGEIIPGLDVAGLEPVDPRFGFAWQPTDDGRTVIRGSIGQFHAGMTSGDWYAPPPEAPPWTTYWLNWDDEWEMSRIGGTRSRTRSWCPAPRTPRPGSTPSASTTRSERPAPFGAQVVYKETKNQIGWYIDDDGGVRELRLDRSRDRNTYTSFKDYSDGTERATRATAPGPERLVGDRPYDQDYIGVFLTYKKRFSKNWDLMASYSFSRRPRGLNPRSPEQSDGLGSQGSVFYGQPGGG